MLLAVNTALSGMAFGANINISENRTDEDWMRHKGFWPDYTFQVNEARSTFQIMNSYSYVSRIFNHDILIQTALGGACIGNSHGFHNFGVNSRYEKVRLICTFLNNWVPTITKVVNCCSVVYLLYLGNILFVITSVAMYGLCEAGHRKLLPERIQNIYSTMILSEDFRLIASLYTTPGYLKIWSGTCAFLYFTNKYILNRPEENN